MTGNKINWQDLAADLMAKTSMQRKEAEAFVRSFFDTLAQGIMEDKSVKVKALGTFKMVDVQERESVNVNTGERFTISGHAKIGFLPDNALKELVNKPFADFQTVILNEGTSQEDMENIDLKYPAGTFDKETEEDTLMTSSTPLAEENGTEKNTSKNTKHEAKQPDADNAETDVPQQPVTIPSTTPKDAAEQEKSEKGLPHSIGRQAAAKEKDEAREKQDSTLENASPTTSESVKKEKRTEKTAACDSKEADKVVMDSTNQAGTMHDSLRAVSVVKESPRVQEKANNPQPIKNRHNIWRTLFLTLITLQLILASYMVGYLRLIDLSWLCLPPAETATEVQAPAILKPEEKQSCQDTCTTQVHKLEAVPADKEPAQDAKATPEKPAETQEKDKQKQEQTTSKPRQADRQQLLQAAKQYPQVEGGKYLITGIRKTRNMQWGENLYRIARQEYGDEGIVVYIKALNQFADPNNIPVGCEVKLPELTEINK